MHAHCTEEGTKSEGREEASGNVKWVGNGVGNGDRDRVVTATGAEAREQTQDGNGDGSRNGKMKSGSRRALVYATRGKKQSRRPSTTI